MTPSVEGRLDGISEPWAGHRQWRILATRFGNGHGFLATWHAWRSDPQAPSLLHYVALEAAPLPADNLVSTTGPVILPLARELASQWWGLTPGFHRLRFDNGRVLLTVCVGDIATSVRELAFRADTLVVEGGTAGVPHVRSLARLCRRGTRVLGAPRTSETATEWEQNGFCMQGGASREAIYDPRWDVRRLAAREAMEPSHCVVIGAGMAGAAAASAFAHRGWSVRVLDAEDAPAQGASALPVGLLAPHQSPDDNLLSRLSRAGVRTTLAAASLMLTAGEDYEQATVIEKRLEDPRPPPDLGAALDPWTRPGENPGEWLHDTAAWLKPAALVDAWLRHPSIVFSGGQPVRAIRPNTQGWSVLGEDGAELARADLVIVAAALGSGSLLHDLALHPVRGQVSWAHLDSPLPCASPLNGNGHFIPRASVQGRPAWLTGSTYGRGETDTRARQEDHAANLTRLATLDAGVAQQLRQMFEEGKVNAWTGVRCASRDRRPYVGLIEPGLAVCTAMGSRGLTFAALAAELLAAQIHEEPWPIERKLAQALSARR